MTLEYFEKWTVWLEPITKTFKWIELTNMLHWSDGEAPIKATVVLLTSKAVLQQDEFNDIFTDFSHVKSYLCSQPNIIDEWNSARVSIEDRWLRIFSHLNTNSVSFKKFAKLVEYALMIPGIDTFHFICQLSM